MSVTTDTAISCGPTHIYDIEHIPVDNDPRKWTSFRKNLTLTLVASASLVAGLSVNIQNPAVHEMHDDLGATSGQFSLSISLSILFQGVVPMMWTAISEIKGRKLVYIISLAMFTAGSVAVALSPNMNSVIGFRCLQAAGSSSVIAIGASTLADIFETEERGTKMGIFYLAPLLGPAIGPLLGGALTTTFNWRAMFWFLAIYAGITSFSFLLFWDTHRKERSLVYQKALKSRLRQLSRSDSTQRGPETSVRSSLTAGGIRNPAETVVSDQEKGDVQAKGAMKGGEKHPFQCPKGDWTQAKVSLRDVNPFKPVWLCLRRRNNFTILIASGLSFAYNYVITYMAARTLVNDYGYNPLKTGLVTLAFGLGCLAGSLGGGRWSDHKLAMLKKANGGEGYPEMRLRSTILGIVLLPPFIAILGWTWQARVHVAAVCVFLFLNGFFYIWPYTSILAYILDSNKGRSSTAVATNSAFRGFFAFLATELVVPLQDGLGNGWSMTLWAFVMFISGLLTLVTYWKGKGWREKAELWEAGSEGTE